MSDAVAAQMNQSYTYFGFSACSAPKVSDNLSRPLAATGDTDDELSNPTKAVQWAIIADADADADNDRLHPLNRCVCEPVCVCVCQ